MPGDKDGSLNLEGTHKADRGTKDSSWGKEEHM